jgi:DNA-binding helix-hairpin-helix protein with protein kinase domain
MPPGVSASDIERILSEVQSFVPVALSIATRSTLQIPTVAGTPFPSTTGKTQPAFYFGCFILGAALVGLVAAPPAFILWIILGFVGWGMVAEGPANPLYSGEILRRESALQSASVALDKLLDTMRSDSASYQRAFDQEKKTQLHALSQLAVHHRSLPAIRSRLSEQHAREFQLSEFLDRKRLINATIRGIGDKRSSALHAHGIETALDAKRLNYLPGFGPFLLSQLKGWVRQCEASFRFNPSQPMSAASKQEIDREVFKIEQQWLTEAVECKRRLLALTARAQQGFAASQFSLANAVQVYAKAVADRSLAPPS